MVTQHRISRTKNVNNWNILGILGYLETADDLIANKIVECHVVALSENQSDSFVNTCRKFVFIGVF